MLLRVYRYLACLQLCCIQAPGVMNEGCKEAQSREEAVVPDRDKVQMESRLEKVGGCRALWKKLR